jgi:AraC family transcriptional regulator of adaptative response/methylated-DNA-[protein]-cysteine methyltransferase
MTNTDPAQPLPSKQTMLRAFASKDSRFDGVFFVAVKTTSVFCRPVCRAKPPRPENVEFFATAKDAMHHGYRACKLCRPLDSGNRPPQVVERLMQLIETSPSTRLREGDLLELGIDPSTARRQFRAYCGMTFAQYQRARRMGLAMRGVRGGESVTAAQLDAGYESASGFREAFTMLFGTRPGDGESAEILISKWIPTPLGSMLAITSDDGLVLFDFADRKGLERAILHLRRRLRAVIVPGESEHLAQLSREIDEYFRGERRSFDVKLAPVGSDFQRTCWNYLRTIDFGSTRSYADAARSIGNASAVRAVASANGMNYIAILIPCHRVIGSNGDLTGYGGGLARKRWLIDHERGYANTAANSVRSSANGRPARNVSTASITAPAMSSAPQRLAAASAASSRA